MKNTIVEFVLCCLALPCCRCRAHTSNTIRQCSHCKNQIMHTHEVLTLRKGIRQHTFEYENRLLFFQLHFSRSHLTFKYSNVFACLFIHSYYSQSRNGVFYNGMKCVVIPLCVYGLILFNKCNNCASIRSCVHTPMDHLNTHILQAGRERE